MSYIKRLYFFISKKYQSVHLEYRVNLSPRYGHGKPTHKTLEQIIGSKRLTYISLLKELVENQDKFLQWADKQDHIEGGGKPHYINGFFSPLDMMGLYTIISHFSPKKYLEIGSGNSTKVARTCINDKAIDCEIISIDPHPRADIDAISNRIIRKPIETIEQNIILNLEANDILFIDNSHRILPNSDAMVFFMEIMHALPKGVIVHLHDIYLPYDYPQFMCDRLYSEQYGLACYLLSNPQRYSVLMPMYYISQDEELREELKSLWDSPKFRDKEHHGGSFWFKIE